MRKSRLANLAMKGKKRMGAVAMARKRNPLLDLPITKDIEKDDAAECSAIVQSMKDGQEEVRKVIGNGYWLNLVFLSEDQRNEFVHKIGWDKFSDDMDTYYDGVGIAKSLGVELTAEKLPFRGRREDRRLIEEVGIIPQR